MEKSIGEPAVKSLLAASKNRIKIESEKIDIGAEIFKNLIMGILPSVKIISAVKTINARGIQISLIKQTKKRNGKKLIILDNGFNLFKKEALS